MGEEGAQGSGSLVLAGDFSAQSLSEGKRKLDKEPVLNVFKNAAADRKFNLEAAIKSVEEMSNELKKLNGNSEFTIQLKKQLFKEGTI